MRLKPNEIDIIKSNIKKYIPDAKIILFGSRVYDFKKGGDIDIFVETKQDIGLSKQIKILTDIKLAGIDRKVDLVIKTPRSENIPIFQTIEQEGVVL